MQMYLAPAGILSVCRGTVEHAVIDGRIALPDDLAAEFGWPKAPDVPPQPPSRPTANEPEPEAILASPAPWVRRKRR